MGDSLKPSVRESNFFEDQLAELEGQAQQWSEAHAGIDAGVVREYIKGELERFETIVNNIVGGIQVCYNDEDFTLDYVSDGFLRLTGYSREEVLAIGNHCGLVCLADVADFKEKVKRQLQKNGTASVEYRLPKRDGSLLWVLDKSMLVKKPGEAERVQSIITDITIQKEREEALRISEKRYEIAMSYSGVTMFDYNTITRQMTLFGSDPDNYNLPTVVENAVETLVQTGYVQPESVEDFRELYRRVEEGVPRAQAIICICDAQGQEGIFELILTNVFDSSNKPTVAVGVKRDITKGCSLERERQYSRSLISNQLLIYEANMTRDRVLFYNQEWAAQCGFAQPANSVKYASFTRLKEAMIGANIAPEFCQRLREKLSSEELAAAYGRGQRILSLEYRKAAADHEDYQWYRMNINIIRDTLTGDIIIRCYLANINEEKLKELKVVEEQQYYESMVAKSTAVFTADVTQNLLLSGHEELFQLLKVAPTNDYTQAFRVILERAIHPEDRSIVNGFMNRVSLLDAYAAGKQELVCEYRRLYQGQYIWVRATVHLMEEARSDSVKAFIYEENINEQKLSSLEMAYRSEHDPLTGLYNKAATQQRITDFLATEEGKQGLHALFFLDVDHFKGVNDGFGHAYGDEVLSKTAEKLGELFRSVDILGRVGGDEFIILMKHIDSEQTAQRKGQQMCDRIISHFGEDRFISISVGIALYGRHGVTYQELYRNADTALYLSKASGRSRSTLYDCQMKPMAPTTL